MLTITDAQLEALQDAAEARRCGVNVEWLAERFPEDAELLGAAGMEHVVQFGIRRARRHGFAEPRSLTRYIVLMFVFGSFFDEDVLFDWPAGALAGDGDENTRIDRLAAAGKAYLDPIAGPDGAQYRRALVRAFQLGFRELDVSPDRVDDRIGGVLRQVYPEQARTLSPGRIAAALAQAGERSSAYGLSPGAGPMIWALLMVLIGGGFDRDPLHPWAGALLSAPEPDDPRRRSRALYDGAMRRLAEYMAANRKRRTSA